ncbi:hypothetical protein [Chondromyces crocatus]|uniref:Uncharacterized protein n=1 Tax=Chondromyces crocatus TaxID=52 RepID=A0A0K1ED36_CHOCO|nr:hypothetical protein [Chondromyces crocatus]AKT38791.1 uncharacterized protein CMC5_029370 [Chondromyces crocatus]
MSRPVLVPSVVAGGLVLVIASTGCEGLSYYPYDCKDLSECPGSACTGQCVPLAPLGFDGPALLWTGPGEEAPECPARAPVEVYSGYAGLESSHVCPECACSAPACVLPTGVTASNTQQCQGPVFTPVDAPANWTGTCQAAEAVIGPASLRSVTIEPVTERPCAPLPPTTPAGVAPTQWTQRARACAGEAVPGVCNDPGLTCLPSAAPPPPGFQQCIMHLVPDDGTGVHCPASYPDKKVFYGRYEDTRACGACTCTETVPSSCSAWMSLYQGGACTNELLSVALSLGDTGCTSILMSPATLGSISASWMTNAPGSCEAAGGEALGSVEPADPRVFCCQPLPGGQLDE